MTSESHSLLDLYRTMLLEVVDAPCVPSVVDPHSIGSDWGRCARPFREIIGTVMRIDSGEAFLFSTARPLNVEYAVLSSVWIILGRSDVAPLLLYNSRGAEFSADGYTLSGAFGKRLRGVEIDQLEAVVRLIQRDPSSRRAICFIGRADDHTQASRDFPCAASIQFFHRVGRLNMIVYMRSQSLFGVFPYDLVNFRYLLQYVAWRLSCDAGQLTFCFGSLHVYDNELHRIDRFLADDEAAFRSLPDISWESMGQLFSDWVRPVAGRHALQVFLRDQGYVV